VRIAVVGGGITGLSAAYELVTGTEGIEVVVLEASRRWGGKIRTGELGGLAVDEAADAFLARVPDAVGLCRQLGLGDQLVTPATSRAYLYSLGELRPFPEGGVLGVPTDLHALAASGALTPEGVDRVALDLTMGPDPARFGVDDPPDESVGTVVRRRVGDEVFERLVAPLLSGVHAGNADRLSLAAGAPQFAAALHDHPSLIEGLRAQRAAAAAAAPPGAPAPVFFGLAGGTETLVDALVVALVDAGADLRLDASATGLRSRPGGPGYLVTVGAEEMEVDGVVLAAPLPFVGALLAPHLPEVAGEMAAVDWAEVALVTLVVPSAGIDRELDGSGFLVAPPEGLVLTACSWASSKWAHLSRPGQAVLRASVGRADDRRGTDLDDDALLEVVRADLATTMQLRGEPTELRVRRWPRALPQFGVGHLDRARAWSARLAEACPGVAVAGAGVLGLGIPACIGQGRRAARAVLAETSVA
jgi:oxygen-dependent protoporphyrinogen oxidase